MKKFVPKKRSIAASQRRAVMASTSKYSLDDMYDTLIEIGVSEETLGFATGTYGYNETTLCDVLYYFTGYRDFDQLEDEE